MACVSERELFNVSDPDAHILRESGIRMGTDGCEVGERVGCRGAIEELEGRGLRRGGGGFTPTVLVR